MLIQLYQKPTRDRHASNILPPNSSLTVTESACRVYFSNEIVEQYQLLSFPPTFASDKDGNWYLALTEENQHSFPLREHKGTYFFHYSDLVHNILNDFPEYGKKVHFILEPTQNPLFLKLIPIAADEVNRSKLSRIKRYMEQNQESGPISSFYDRVMNQ